MPKEQSQGQKMLDLEFRRGLRKALRSFFEKQEIEREVAAAFGDACAFYLSMGGLSWKTAVSLGAACFFYPNEILTTSDDELLRIPDIGPARPF